jgi:hypothetical protein
MALNINDFLQLKPIIDQVQQSPTSKVKISKSQNRILASMSEDNFNSFLELFKKSESAKAFSSNRIKETSSSGLIKSIHDNMEIIKNARAQKISARETNLLFARKAMIDKQKAVSMNFLESQKSGVNFLKTEGKPLSHLTEPLATSRKNISSVRNKSHLAEISGIKIPGLDPIQNQILRQDLMQEHLSPDFMKSHLRSYGSTTTDAEKRVRVKVGQTVREQRKADFEIKKEEKRAQQILDKQTARQASSSEFEARVIERTPKNTPVRSAETVSSTARGSSRVAEMLGEDTVRAASVIHSSKMSYAAIGTAGIAAAFGIATVGREKRNIKQKAEGRR